MALVVFLRGINVGGHRSFRPSVLARELVAFDVLNIGTSGTFVVRKPPSRAALRAALSAKLPFATDIMICEGRELVRLSARYPFGDAPPTSEIIRFVSVLARRPRTVPSLPLWLPARKQWLLRVLATEERFIVGEYRRQMKSIAQLAQLDRLFGAPVTTRGWGTLAAVVRLLQT